MTMDKILIAIDFLEIGGKAGSTDQATWKTGTDQGQRLAARGPAMEPGTHE